MKIDEKKLDEVLRIWEVFVKFCYESLENVIVFNIQLWLSSYTST